MQMSKSNTLSWIIDWKYKVKIKEVKMSIVDLTADFHSYVEQSHISYSSSWNTSTFIKSANSALQQMSTLELKLSELKKTVKSSSRFDKDKNNKMMLNIEQSIRAKKQNIKRLCSFQLDIKGNYSLAKNFKDSLLAALQLRLLKASFEFKQVFEQNCLKGRPNVRKNSRTDMGIKENDSSQINLNKSHFLSQTQEQLIEQATLKEYKQIEKSIGEIFEMYKNSSQVVRLQGLLIDQIHNNIEDIDDNVEKGKKNISQVHRRQSKNRSLIIKMFTALYIITFVYIVFLS